jgi:hypothetical protein
MPEARRGIGEKGAWRRKQLTVHDVHENENSELRYSQFTFAIHTTNRMLLNSEMYFSTVPHYEPQQK